MTALVSVSEALRELLTANVGRTVVELAREVDATDINLEAKNAHAVVARRLLEGRGLAAGLDDQGVTVKVVTRGPDGRVFEKMTFRNFSHDELPRETWETSQFRGETRHMLIIIFEADERGLPISEHVLAGGLEWQPSAEQDALLRTEWSRCREAITYRYNPPRESETQAVHVGTKGRDSFDLEKTRSGERVAKQCLCLNKTFVEGLLARSE